MKGMEGNENCDWAKNLYEVVIGSDEGTSITGVVPLLLAAQVQATLALAHEQRTANLIAFEQAQWQAWVDDSLNADGQAIWSKAAEQIPGRLGIA